jgi:hypothetical protein
MDDEDSVLRDASGNGNDGEYKNETDSGPIGISGDGDSARVFLGADGYGFVNDMPAPSRNKYTMAAFVQFDDDEDGMVMQHGRAGALFRRGDQLVFRQTDEEVAISVPGGIVPGCWYFVAGRWDGFTATVYAGTHSCGGPGVQWFAPQSVASSSVPTGEGSTFYVGYGEHAPWLHGMLDEVAYFDSDIGAVHVRELFLGDPPPDVHRTGSTYSEPSTAGPATPAATPASPVAKPKPKPAAGRAARVKALTKKLTKARAKLRALRRRHAPRRKVAAARRTVTRLQVQLRAAKRRG